MCVCVCSIQWLAAPFTGQLTAFYTYLSCCHHYSRRCTKMLRLMPRYHAPQCHKKMWTQDQMDLLLGAIWGILLVLFWKAPLDISFLVTLVPLISPMQLNAMIHIIHQHSYGHKADFLSSPDPFLFHFAFTAEEPSLWNPTPPYWQWAWATQILPYNMKIITTAPPLPKGWCKSQRRSCIRNCFVYEWLASFTSKFYIIFMKHYCHGISSFQEINFVITLYFLW